MQWMKWVGASLVLCAALALGCQKNDTAGGGGSADTSGAAEGDHEGHDHDGDGHDHDHDGHDHGDHDHGDHDHGDHDHGNAGGDKISANLAKLSPEDRALAEKQKTCPVSDEPLGSMGVPIKTQVDGKDVFVCCKGCLDELKKKDEKKEEAKK